MMSQDPLKAGKYNFVTQDKDGQHAAADLTQMTGIGGKRRANTQILMDQPLNLLTSINGQALSVVAPGVNLGQGISLQQGKYRLLILAIPEE